MVLGSVRPGLIIWLLRVLMLEGADICLAYPVAKMLKMETVLLVPRGTIACMPFPCSLVLLQVGIISVPRVLECWGCVPVARVLLQRVNAP